MTILVIDDEEIILKGMERVIKSVVGDGTPIYTALDPFTALDIAREKHVDTVFSDVDMPGMNGLKLAGEIHEINPAADIVFVTGYAHYSLDAWKTAAKDFLLKPITDIDVRKTLDKLKEYHVNDAVSATASGGSSKGPCLEAKCFGNFELFFNDKIIFFGRKKSKEMLAYLIDRRGAMVSTAEIRAILWEDEADSDEKKGYVRVLANDIRKSLEEIGLSDVLINNSDGYAIDINKVKCDYIDFLAGKKKAIGSFCGEYMSQYDWGEVTLSGLLS